MLFPISLYNDQQHAYMDNFHKVHDAYDQPRERNRREKRNMYVTFNILYQYTILAIKGFAISFFRNFATELANLNGKSTIPKLIFKINVRILRTYFKHFATSFFFFSVLDL